MAPGLESLGVRMQREVVQDGVVLGHRHVVRQARAGQVDVDLVLEFSGSVDHAYKYRLFYGFPGRRLVGYGNERGKGDHRHADGKETRYAFVSADRLIEDFMQAVEQRRKGDANSDDPDRAR